MLGSRWNSSIGFKGKEVNGVYQKVLEEDKKKSDLIELIVLKWCKK
jgi:hypothetical protein